MRKRQPSFWFQVTASVVLMLMLLAGCGSGAPAGRSSPQESSRPSSTGAAPPMLDMGGAGRGESGMAPPLLPDKPGAPRSQALIQNASISLEVGTQLDEALDSLQELADRYGGFIAESERSGQQPGYRRGSAILRVPSRHFHEVLHDLSELGTVTRRQTYTEDVGDQLVDLEVRRRSAEEREARLRELIGQATEITDLIALEGELARVRTEIETLAARSASLEDQVAYSTFDIYLREVAPGQEPAGPVSVWRRTAIAFERGMDNAAAFASGLLVFVVASLPVLVVLAAVTAPVWWALRAWRRAVKRRRARQTAAAAEAGGSGGPGAGSGGGPGGGSGGGPDGGPGAGSGGGSGAGSGGGSGGGPTTP